MNAQLRPPSEPRIPLGIHLNVPGETYYVRRVDEASNSGLTIIDEQSPAHYLWWCEHPEDDETSAALAFGSAFHVATLEPERFGDTYIVQPEDAPSDLRRFRDAKKPSDATLRSVEWWDAWDAKCAGKIQISRKDYATVAAMGASLRAYEMEFNGTTITGAELIDACEKEVTLSWIDEDTGILCKARADLWMPDLAFAADLKSTFDGSFAAFSHSINRYRYHTQHGHYCEGFRACGQPLRSFALLPVEKRAPYIPASWHIDAASEERGWAIRQRSMRKLDTCLKSGRWPGHTTTVQAIGIPAYGHYDAKE